VKAAQMSDVFVDTAGWGHLIDPKQSCHALTVSIYRAGRRSGRRFVTTNYIITELVALSISPLQLSRPVMIEFIKSLKASPYVEVVYVNQAIDEQAWKLLVQRPDKRWSLVDCVSFVVMWQRGITEALTSDYHFEQAGFLRLLKV
jgi:predicted nucleic acid-binding protein